MNEKQKPTILSMTGTVLEWAIYQKHDYKEFGDFIASQLKELLDEHERLTKQYKMGDSNNQLTMEDIEILRDLSREGHQMVSVPLDPLIRLMFSLNELIAKEKQAQEEKP